MESLQDRIATVLRARRERYIRACEHLIAMAPPDTVRDHSLATARQMTDGFLAVIFERLENRGDEVRTSYVETVVPSVVASGVPLRGVVGGAVHFSMIVTSDVARHLPESHDEIIEWFGNFFAGYITQLASVATKAGAV